MRDYSLNNEEQQEYILSYKVDNGKLIVKLATGDIYTIDYSEEKEQAIISKMEKQARLANVEELTALDKILSISQPLVLPIAISNFINYNDLFYCITLGIIAGGAIVYPAKCIFNKVRERDILKLNYFLDNKEELNSNLCMSKNMMLGVSSKAVSEIQKAKNQNKEPININNIDSYSLNDLKKIRENISRFSSIDLNSEETTLDDTTIDTQSFTLRK